jgi:hypothetical protein
MVDKTSNTSAKVTRRAAAKEASPRKAAPRPQAGEIVLLSGGNPQIAKGHGDAPVQAYIAAMPGWKSDLGRRLDEIIVRTVPGLRKAVKWNSPFYGAGDEDPENGGGWFLSFHCFTKYVKVTFFRGASLRPHPPGTSKHKEVRYLDIYEGQFDEAQFANWVKQASQLPAEQM